MRKAFYVKVLLEGSYAKHHTGANIGDRPVLWTSEKDAQKQVDFYMGEYNKAMQQAGLPKAVYAKVIGIDYTTYEKGIRYGLSFSDALESAEGTYLSKMVSVKNYERRV